MRKLALGLTLLSLASLSAQADTYNYTGPNDGLWSTAGNWSDITTPPTGTFPNTNTDVANLSISGGSQTVIYDAGASGALGTLNLGNTGPGTDELDMQRAAGIAIGTTGMNTTLSSANGLSEILLDASAAGASAGVNSTGMRVGGSSSTVASGTLNLNAGGQLEIHPWVGTGNSSAAFFFGNLNIAGGSFLLDQALLKSTDTNPNSASTSLDGSLTMSSGTLTLGQGQTASSSVVVEADNRLTVTGTVNITGGNITNGGTGGVTLTLNGASNTITGLTSGNVGGANLTFNGGNINESLTTDQVLTGLVLARLSTGKTLTITNTNTVATGNIAQLAFLPADNGSETVQLGSNLVATGAAASPIIVANGIYGATTTESLTVDLAGNTYDMTRTAAAFTPGNDNVVGNKVAWTFTSSTGNGTMKAVGYNLSSASSTTVGANTTLQATGGVGTANILSNNAANTTTPGTIASTSTFLYSGNATAANAATLVSTRTIGNLAVQNGALNINQASLTAGGGVAVSNGGNLILDGGLTAATLTLGSGQNFNVNTGALTFALGSGSGIANGSSEIFGNNGTGAGGTFTFSGLTLDISQGVGFSTSNTYQLMADFASSTALANIATNIAGFDANIDSTGLLSFSPEAVPEPGTGALLLFGGMMLVMVVRRHSKKIA
jgi:hypothetical protein